MSQSAASPLTPVQREIMEFIWAKESVTVSEAWEAISARRPVARNTVQTLIVRLEDKGWLSHKADGRTFRYSAARSKQVSLGAKVAQLVDRFFAGSPEKMVTALLDYRGLTPDEAETIRGILKEAEASRHSTLGSGRKKP
jgi:predicted transcriptional regulator